MINVQVTKTGNDNNTNLIRKFTRRVQEAGILNRVRSLRYNKRDESSYVRKKKTLKYLNRKKEIEHLIKMGKMRPREEHGSRR